MPPARLRSVVYETFLSSATEISGLSRSLRHKCRIPVEDVTKSRALLFASSPTCPIRETEASSPARLRRPGPRPTCSIGGLLLFPWVV